ncbi:MAG: type II toxin-antitoxin system VapC family toxin [Nocardioides sp.]
MSTSQKASVVCARDSLRLGSADRGCGQQRRRSPRLHGDVHRPAVGRPSLLVPQTVVAEVGHMLAAWVSTEVEAKFLDAVAAEDFQVVNLTSADFARMAELVRDYDDLQLGTTDASVIALAERLGVREIATLDRRHLTAVRLRHIDAFTLLPETLG